MNAIEMDRMVEFKAKPVDTVVTEPSVATSASVLFNHR